MLIFYNFCKMKIIKAILILSCIMFSLQFERVSNALESLKRAEKAQTKKAAMKKAEKKLAKSLMARIFKVTLKIDNETTGTEATFDAKEIKKPVDGKIRGMYFTIAAGVALSEKLKAILVAIPNTTSYFLPYRSIPSSFKMNAPAGAGNYITCSFQSGPNFLSMTVLFEYDPDWEVISKDELGTLVGWLNTLRVNRLTIVEKLKAQALTYANGYITNKVSYDAALKGMTGLDAQIIAANTQITALQAVIDKNNQAIKDAQAQITTKEQNLAKLKQQQTDAMGKVSQGDQFIAAQTATLKTLNLQKESGISDSSTFEYTMAANKDGFINTLASVKEEYASDYSILENARKAVFDNAIPDLNTCNSLITSATPSN